MVLLMEVAWLRETSVVGQRMPMPANFTGKEKRGRRVSSTTSTSRSDGINSSRMILSSLS
eukprot:13520768-Ditylum_brightwellii.AAC.1